MRRMFDVPARAQLFRHGLGQRVPADARRRRWTGSPATTGRCARPPRAGLPRRAAVARLEPRLTATPATAWIGDFGAGAPAWIQWSTPRPVRIASADACARPSEPVRTPDGRARQLAGRLDAGRCAVRPAAASALPRPVRAARVPDRRAARVGSGRRDGGRPASGRDRRDHRNAGSHAYRTRARATFVAPCGTASFRRRRRHRRRCGSAARWPRSTQGRRCRATARAAPRGAVRRNPAAGGRAGAVRRRLPAPARLRPRGRRWPRGGQRARRRPSVRPGAAPTTTCACRSPHPSWLVLGEGSTAAGRRSATGARWGRRRRSTATPTAGRWGRAAEQVRFTFAPNRVAGIAYLVSAIAGLLCLICADRQPPVARSSRGARRPGTSARRTCSRCDRPRRRGRSERR